MKQTSPKALGDEPNKKERIKFRVDGDSQVADRTWFRGEHCNFNPSVKSMTGGDAVQEHVLAGWVPPKPLITRDTNIVAFGSCFAENITNWLSKRDFNVLTSKDGDWGDTYVVRFGEGMVNSFVIRQQFEWAFDGKVFTEDLWHGYDAKNFGYDDDIRRQTRDVFLTADVFIITLGLSEIWCDKETGGVFWRAVPAEKYDPDRHVFRVSSVAENRENIEAIYELIRKHRPDAKIILTLSPIPLVATFRPVSCLTANSVSKSILRAAIDEVLRGKQESDDHLYYWPSYEIVTDVFADRWKSDRRHVRDEILDYIMTLFESNWCEGEPQLGVNQAWVRARCATGTLPRRLYGLMENGGKRLDKHITLLEENAPRDAELVKAALREMGAPTAPG